MKTILIPEFDCPLCGAKNEHIQVLKPNHFTPSVKKTVCDTCESTLVIRVSVPRNRENTGKVNLQTVSFIPSQKLVELLQTREAEKVKTETSVEGTVSGPR